MKIDAHQHFWHPARGDYDWMPKDIPVLNRVYVPQDLGPTLDHHGIAGTVLIQAAATVHETEYMLGLADATPWIKGVVGWIDFEDENHRAHLERLAAHPKFCGVRPMIQDIPDVNWMLRDDVQWAYRALIDLDLTFDALGFPQHIPNFLTLAQRYPDLRIVYDHCMKPQIRDQMAGRDAYTDWATGITQLAEETHGVIKFSALLTEADNGWTRNDIRPFARHVLDMFGADRVMWGSDWPVCRIRSEYGDWHAMARELTSHLTDAEQDQIFGGTATRFYRLA
ncbi:MAG: amidohydrolase family protein [Pseudomonadota bacterium]